MLDRTKVVYITEAGKEMLEALLAKKLKRIQELARNAEPFEARSAGKCFGQEMADPHSEELEQLRTDAERLKLDIRHAVVMPTKSQQRDCVELGNGITLEYACRIAGKARHVRRNFIVVGHGEGDCKADPPRIAYDAELVKPFMGASKGFMETGWLDGKARVLRLTNIVIPK